MNNLSGDFTGLIPEKKKKKKVETIIDVDNIELSISDEQFDVKLKNILASNDKLKSEILDLYNLRCLPELYSAEICTKQLSTLLQKFQN